MRKMFNKTRIINITYSWPVHKRGGGLCLLWVQGTELGRRSPKNWSTFMWHWIELFYMLEISDSRFYSVFWRQTVLTWHRNIYPIPTTYSSYLDQSYKSACLPIWLGDTDLKIPGYRRARSCKGIKHLIQSPRRFLSEVSRYDKRSWFLLTPACKRDVRMTSTAECTYLATTSASSPNVGTRPSTACSSWRQPDTQATDWPWHNTNAN